MAATDQDSNTLNNKASEVLQALKQHFGVSDQEIADATDGAFSRSQIEARRAGRKTLDLDDLETLGKTFDIPATTFLMERDEAIRYVLDNPPTRGFAASRCTQPRLFNLEPDLSSSEVDDRELATAA